MWKLTQERGFSMPELTDEQLDKYCYQNKTLSHFMGLKTQYDNARADWKLLWTNALAAFNLDKNKLLDESYLSDSKFLSPAMATKLKGVVARKQKIHFNVQPFGRVEDSKIRQSAPKGLVDLINTYIFKHQIPKIKFTQQFRLLEFLQGVFGVGIGYIPHHYEEKELVYGDGKRKLVISKNDTYLEPRLTGDFYTDPTKLNLQDSEANILEDVVSFEDLKALEKREITTVELIEYDDGTKEEVEKKETIGIYENLDMIKSGNTMTEYQEDVLKQFYYATSNISSNFKTFDRFKNKVKKEANQTLKTGMVRIDRCFGKWWFQENGEWVYGEALVEIANSKES